MTGLSNISEAIDLIQGTSIAPSYINPNMKQVIFDVTMGVEFTLNVVQAGLKVIDGYQNYYTYTKTISSDLIINHAFIARFYLATPYTDGILTEGTNVM
jgi:hypothetical protein